MDFPPPRQCRGCSTSLDSTNLMGTVLSGIAYGVVFTICTLTLCTSSPSYYVWKLSWRTLVTCWLLLLATACTVLQTKWTLLAFVTQQDVSPSDFIKENTNNWIYVMLNVLYVIINWSADGILVFRTFRFFRFFNQSPQWWILPAPLYLSSLVTGSLALRELAAPGTTQYNNKLANWLVIYRTVSLSLCVILTSFIAGRVAIAHRKRDPAFRSPTSPLRGVVMMLVESASLETVSTLVYVITVGLGSPLQNVFLPILGQVQVIAPMLIVYRVARGRDAMAGLSKHHDTNMSLTQPTLSIRTSPSMSFSSMGCEPSASPATGRGVESPRYSFPPPYAASPFNEPFVGIVPPSPSLYPAHMSGMQKLRTAFP